MVKILHTHPTYVMLKVYITVFSLCLTAVSLYHEGNFVNTSNTTPGEMLVIMITTLTLQRRAILKWLFKNKSIFATKEYLFVNSFQSEICLHYRIRMRDC